MTRTRISAAARSTPWPAPPRSRLRHTGARLRVWRTALVLACALWTALPAPAALGQAGLSGRPVPVVPGALAQAGAEALRGAAAQTGEVQDGAARVVDTALQTARTVVGQRAVTLGISFHAVSLTLYRNKTLPDGREPSANLGSEADIAPSARVATGEVYLLDMPMRGGRFRLGYDLEFNLTTFRTTRQEVLDVLQLEDLGTSSAGRLLALGPLVFVRLGPLYPEGNISWKAGGGAGLGLIDFTADVLFRNNLSAYTARERITYRSPQPQLYLYGVWMLEWDNWRLTFMESNLRGPTGFGAYFYSESSLIIGYSVHF